MNFHAKAALLLVLLGSALIVAYKLGAPLLLDDLQRETSDARATKGKIVIGSDNWIGYFPLCSKEMKREMRRREYLLECEDDNADYAGRMQRLKDGNLQFAVATIDAYLLNGAPKAYPGAIVAVLDESRGGDAIVAWQDQLARVDDLKRKSGVKIAFTPNSPSEHLLKSVGSHFDIPLLRQKSGTWRMEANGSPDALGKLLQKKSAAAVLWEPDVSRALATPGIIKLLGTEDTQRLIVDVLIVSREFSQSHPEAVNDLLAAYYQILQSYADDREKLRRDAQAITGLNPAQTSLLLNGVRWISLAENVQSWLTDASRRDNLSDAIESTLQVLLDAGDFKHNPVPDSDPYRLINSQFAARLFGSVATNENSQTVLERKFSELDDKAWVSLREVGVLRARPILFQSGNADLSLEGKLELDKMAENLRHYPNFRIVVKGHTATQGDAQENSILSHDRADAVARYLSVTYNMDSNRLRVKGLGGTEPLPRMQDESDRAYAYRLPRVEIVLVSEGI